MRRSRWLLAILLALTASCSGGSNPPTSPGGGGGGNHSPTASINTNTTHLAYGAQATITVSATDPDGDQLTYAYAATGGTISSSGPTATTATFTAGSQWGPCSVTVTVADGKGGSIQATSNMYIQNPSPPSLCFSQGSPCTTKYRLVVTPNEAIVVTEIAAQNRYDGSCFPIILYGATGLAIGAHAPHEFADLGCLECSSSPNAMISDWDIDVYGRRAEPDGGSFHVHRIYIPSYLGPQCSP